MNALDLKGPSSQPKSLEKAQRVIDALWRALSEALEQTEQLEEQLCTDSGNSSREGGPDSQDHDRGEIRGQPPLAQVGHFDSARLMGMVTFGNHLRLRRARCQPNLCQLK